jgi:hypothetical protein
MNGFHLLDGNAKILKQDDVAVYITQVVVFGDILSTVEKEIKPFGTVFVSFDIRFVANSELLADLRGALIVTEQNHLDIGMQHCPAFQRIPLDNSTVSPKRLRRSDNRKHLPFRLIRRISPHPATDFRFSETPAHTATRFRVSGCGSGS